MTRRVPAAVAAALVAATVVAGAQGPADARTTARAKPASGAWTGKLARYPTAKLTFRVSADGRKLTRFMTSVVPIVCGGITGPNVRNATFGMDRATIKPDGSFSGTMTVTDERGGKLEQTLTGRFTSARAASGQATYKGGPCNVTVTFTAKRR